MGTLSVNEVRGRWVLGATILGSGMAILDSTIVNIALPEIDADLDAGTAGLTWTVNAYTLTLASLILLGGSLGDRLGRRRASAQLCRAAAGAQIGRGAGEQYRRLAVGGEGRVDQRPGL